MDGKNVVAAVALCSLALGGCDVPTAVPRFETTFLVPAEPVVLPVTSQQATASTVYNLGDVDQSLIDNARGGALRVDVPDGAMSRGSVRVRLEGGGVTVEGVFDVADTAVQRIPLERHEVQALLGDQVTITLSGRLCPRTGCNLTARPPFPTVTVRTRLELALELGGEG